MSDLPTFVGLDSDGCVVDTMAPKQHGFLQPLMIRTLGLDPEVYHACADFVNLYSQTRGVSRYRAIYLTLSLYNRHPAHPKPVPLEDLRAFVESGLPLSNAAVETWLADHPSAFLERILQWSKEVNAAIIASGTLFPAYEGAREALKRMHGRSETGIVSQSPEKVLEQDWGAQGLLPYVNHVAGQEFGDKVAQLTTLTAGRFPKDRILMIGDAPGDLAAARAFGCRFYPILPGQEEASWATFNAGLYDAFTAGRYTPEDEASRVEAFLATLPDAPPWETQA